MDDLLDRYTRVAVDWNIARFLLEISSEIDGEDSESLTEKLDNIKLWLNSPEFGRMSSFSDISEQVSVLQKELESIISGSGESSMDDVTDSLTAVYIQLMDFRDRLDGGVSFLLLTQVFLILLLIIIITFAMEDRSRQRMEMEASRRIQIEVNKAQEEERNRIALDLHDDIAQELSWMRMDLVKGDFKISQMAVFDKLISRVRDMSQGLRMPDFTTEFFNDAVRDLVVSAEHRSSVLVKYLPGPIFPDVNPEIYGHLYRIIQECLTNAAKHAGLCKAFIELQEEDNRVYLEYRDDGTGFIYGDMGKDNRMGLKGIRNRVVMMDGEMSISAMPGRGMNLQCRIPLKSGGNDKS